MSDQDEDLLFSHDQDQSASAWWAPSSLLTAEATSITAFAIALSSTVGIGGVMLVVALSNRPGVNQTGDPLGVN